MKALSILNWKYGLDARREALTSQPGTLVTLENAVINPGGEIEGRKAFVRTKLPTDTFGFTATDDGLEVYGSRPTTKATTNRARTGNVATLTLGSGHGFAVGDIVTVTGVSGTGYNVVASPVTAVASTTISYASTGSDEGTTADVGGTVTLILPLVGTYQTVYVRLQHPAVLDGATYDATKHAMTGVKWSQPYLFGKAFVCATFADTNSFYYYDGVLVEQSRRGMVLAGWNSNTNLASQAADDFDGLADFVASSSSNTMDVYSTFGVDYILEAEKLSSASGVVSVQRLSDNTAGTDGVAAAGSFRVFAFATAGSVSSIKVGTGSPVELLGASVSMSGKTTTSEVATALAAGINAVVSTPRYTAVADADVVNIYAAADQGDTPNTFVVETVADQVCMGLAAFTLLGTGVETAGPLSDGTIDLFAGDTVARTTDAAWAAAIVAKIIAKNTAYTAVAVGTTFFVAKKTTKSSDSTITFTLTTGTSTPTGNVPLAPSDVVVQAGIPGSNGLEIFWTDPTGATTINVYRKGGGPGIPAGDYQVITTVASGTGFYLDNAVVNDTVYMYKLTGVNSSGESGFSAIVGAIVNTGAANQTPTAEPGNALVVLGTDFIATANFDIYRGTIPAFPPGNTTVVYQFIKTQPVSGGPGTEMTAYTDTGLTNGQAYFYKIVETGASVVTDQLIAIAVPQSGAVIQTLRVVLSISLVTGVGTRQSRDNLVVSGPVSAFPSGGVPPYNWIWTAVDNPDGIFQVFDNVTNTPSQTSKFKGHVPIDRIFFGTFLCTVTDTLGNSATSGLLSVRLVGDPDANTTL